MIVPKQIAAFLKNKIRVGADGSPFPASKNFSYKDIRNEEHTTNFTVAEAMQMDILKDIHSAVESAAEKGWTLEHFKKELRPTLQSKGWWGKKEMIDPLTNEMVKAQLSSDRRLKVIYQTNLRSAYQQGKWERSQNSDIHPYLMYRVGNSKEHRKKHLSWDSLILPKNDSWWNSHYPPNGWGCQCWTQAITENRAEKLRRDGFDVPPSIEDNDGYHVDAKITAPQTRYVSYFNNRKGTIEKVPYGVDPAFNSNVGRAGRDIPLFDSFMQRRSDGSFHPDIEAVAKTILTNKIWRQNFDAFIKNSYSGAIQGYRATPAGFVEGNVAVWLKKNAGIEIGDSVTIALEARLLNGPKAIRHGTAGNAIGKNGARVIIDVLMYGQVYFEDNTKNLIYIFPHSENQVSKITVTPIKKTGGRGSAILSPVIDNIQTIPISGEASEYKRIVTKLHRIK
ncbi:MAG: phage head morphogenesis protein [Spirochaetaceae bacterium]|jgi:hypothetical protein|nr:phage head morphogenesis protein [Spirochaetaceae bacterium]